MDNKITQKLTELLKEEEELQFDFFNAETAWEIGKLIIERAQKENPVITVEIMKNNQIIFKYSFDSVVPDKDEWVKRKSNVTKRFGHSSYYMGLFLKSVNKTIEQEYFISSSEYGAYGGAYPIFVKSTGQIGIITVSGLTEEEDHQLVVDAVRSVLKK